MSTDKKIYITEGDCHHCYKCARVCPVKAIEIKGAQASIRDSLCVVCGQCLDQCPQGLIKLQGSRNMVECWMDQGHEVIVSLHWSWFRKFRGCSAAAMVASLREIGFKFVSEGLWGLAMYNQELSIQLSKLKVDHHLVLTSECVVTHSMVQKYHSRLNPSMSNIVDPMTLHGRMIRKWIEQKTIDNPIVDDCQGKQNDIKILYITPCSGYSNYIDDADNVVMTFDELRSWFAEFNINPSSLSFTQNDIRDAWFPYECSWVPPVRFKNNLMRCFSLDDSLKILSDAKINDSIVLDLMACSGCNSNNSFEAKWESIEDYTISSNYFRNKRYVDKHFMPMIDVYASVNESNNTDMADGDITDGEIIEALESLAKFKEYDHHNCNACGYQTCVNFAQAMAKGMVTKDMCLSYSRTLMMRKYNELMERVPSGVMMVDGKARIINANRNMATIMGNEAMVVYEATQGMKGADVDKLVNFSELIHRVIETGVDVIDQEVEMEDKLLRVSVFNIETGRCVCVLASNLLIGDMLDNQIIVKTQQAIDENMEAVQQIVSLLGKSAARTQKILSMITLKHGK